MFNGLTHSERARRFVTLAKESVNGFVDHKVLKLAAALSYYMAISIAPLLVLAVKVIGLRYGADAASDKLKTELANLATPNIAATLQDIIKQAGKPGSGTVATILSIIIALVGASGVFIELQDSLNTIWEVRPKPNRGIRGIISDRLLAVLMVLGISLLLASSIVIDTIVSASSNTVLHVTGLDHFGLFAKVVTVTSALIVATGLISIMFGALFRWLPDVEVGWRDVGLGAVVTGTLFQLGKFGLSIYLTHASPGSAYGAAGSLVVLIVWIYYSSVIFYYGAEFTRAYADQFGTKIVPSDNAEWISDCEPGQQSSSKGNNMPTSSLPDEILLTPARAEFLRQQRYLARRKAAVPVTPAGRTSAVLPAAAGFGALSALVLGRFFWKRKHAHAATPVALRDKWATALRKWGKTAKLLGASRSKRYAATHGPRGEDGPSWAEVMEQTAR